MLEDSVPRIHVLSPGLVNQIAAGEVVERPASVVKELCENALDAGSSSITVDIEDGGLSLVRVTDDGTGMDHDDALLALERHATSKLRDVDGLATIATMGFRGEAVPAIASVSRLRLDTSPGLDGAGTRAVVEGGALVETTPVARPRGTTVEVRDLFFNTPARRKFMRAAATEAGHVSEALDAPRAGAPGRRLHAPLGRPDPPLARRGEPLSERAAQALGREAARHLVEVDGARGEVRVHGLVTSPDRSQATSRALYLFVNGRYFRDRSVAHSVLRAYAGLLPQGRYPGGVLFVDLPLHQVDVNVHPQKLEVRFAEARAVQDAVHHAVAGALRSAPWLGRAGAALQRRPDRCKRLAPAEHRRTARRQARPARCWPRRRPPRSSRGHGPSTPQGRVARSCRFRRRQPTPASRWSSPHRPKASPRGRSGTSGPCGTSASTPGPTSCARRQEAPWWSSINTPATSGRSSTGSARPSASSESRCRPSWSRRW